jgi:type IV pilus assembly protein PilC
MSRNAIPLSDAIDVIALQAREPQATQVISDIAQELREGIRLSAALRSRPLAFPAYLPALIFAAEESGSLEEILARAESQLEQDIVLRRELLSASLYPCFALGASVVVAMLVLTTVVPAFRDVFAEFNAELPLVTQLALALSDIARAAIIPLLLGTGAVLLVARSGHGKAALQRRLQRVPIYGAFLARCSLARVTGTLATLLSCGLPLSHALNLVADLSANNSQRDELNRFSDEVFNGNPLSSLVRSSSHFSNELAGVVELGERSGSLDEVLGSWSLALQAEAREYAALLKASVEPLLVTTIGLFVGAIMVAVYLPIFGLGGLAQ